MITALFASLFLMNTSCPATTESLVVGSTGVDVAIYFPFLTSGATSTRFDVVFVGEGFTSDAEDVNRFEDYVDEAVKILSEEPYERCAFNFYSVRLISNKPGADHVVESDPLFADGSVSIPYCADTPLNTQFGAPDLGEEYKDWRYLYTPTPERCEEAAALVTTSYDLIVVIVNDDLYGGAAWPESSGYPLLTVSACDEFNHVLLHEMAHKVARLGDEYDNQVGWEGCYSPSVWGEPEYPNVTAEKDPALLVKWEIDEGVPTPTSEENLREAFDPQPWEDILDKAGLWEGAIEYNCGVYRPQYTCRMREEAPFCRVCEEAITAAMSDACPDPEFVVAPFDTTRLLECFLGAVVRIPLAPCLKCLLTPRKMTVDDITFKDPGSVRVEIGPLPGVESVRVVRYPNHTVLEADPVKPASEREPQPVFDFAFKAVPGEIYYLEFVFKRCRTRQVEFDIELWVDGARLD